MGEVEGAIGDQFPKQVVKGHAKAASPSMKKVEPGTILPDVTSRYYNDADDPYFAPRGKKEK